MMSEHIFIQHSLLADNCFTATTYNITIEYISQLFIRILHLQLKLNNIQMTEKNIIDFLKDLANNNEITQEMLDELRPIGSITPKLYGLPKLHKPNIPLRPIISMIKSPQHKLAKFLNKLLQPVLSFYSRYIVTDSFNEVVDRIRVSKFKRHICVII